MYVHVYTCTYKLSQKQAISCFSHSIPLPVPVPACIYMCMYIYNVCTRTQVCCSIFLTQHTTHTYTYNVHVQVHRHTNTYMYTTPHTLTLHVYLQPTCVSPLNKGSFDSAQVYNKKSLTKPAIATTTCIYTCTHTHYTQVYMCSRLEVGLQVDKLMFGRILEMYNFTCT